jgi:hypothetical protein
MFLNYFSLSIIYPLFLMVLGLWTNLTFSLRITGLEEDDPPVVHFLGSDRLELGA